MPLTYAEAVAAVTTPGERFETTTIDIRGVPTTVFRNAPPNLGTIFASARGRGDDTFLVYEDERWIVRGRRWPRSTPWAPSWSSDYGVGKGDRVAIGMRNYPEWIVVVRRHHVGRGDRRCR